MITINPSALRSTDVTGFPGLAMRRIRLACGLHNATVPSAPPLAIRAPSAEMRSAVTPPGCAVATVASVDWSAARSSRKLPSACPRAIVAPSSENAAVLADVPGVGAACVPLDASIATRPSGVSAQSVPDDENASAWIGPRNPVAVQIPAPVAASHSATKPSLSPLATRAESRENATAPTRTGCAVMVRSAANGDIEKIVTPPLRLPNTASFPSGLRSMAVG